MKNRKRRKRNVKIGALRLLDKDKFEIFFNLNGG